MTVRDHPVLGAIIAVVIVGVVAFAANIRAETERADRLKAACVESTRQYVTLHRVIHAIGEPSASGSSLSKLQLPADTPPWFLNVLGQLSSSGSKPDLSNFYRALGPPPRC